MSGMVLSLRELGRLDQGRYLHRRCLCSGAFYIQSEIERCVNTYIAQAFASLLPNEPV